MSALTINDNQEFIQGSQQWLALRKTKITATDASVIMGSNPWKNRSQLLKEKLSDEPPMIPNSRMQRGIDLEPIARSLFNLRTGWDMQPEVVIKDWMMASLDGRDADSGHILEIKCPREKDHNMALSGRVPDHYYPQLQHQMYVCNVNMMYYFSFDGADGVTVKVKRDDAFIEKMLIEEKKFFDCMVNKVDLEPSEDDYTQREDLLWDQCASRWKEVTKAIKELEEEENELRKQLIFLSGEKNSRGSGISLCKVERKGGISYDKIPELKGVDLEKYRKENSSSWRINLK